jgi:hypothetical protein
VSLVLVVEVSIVDIVHVILVDDCLMPAERTVSMGVAFGLAMVSYGHDLASKLEQATRARRRRRDRFQRLLCWPETLSHAGGSFHRGPTRLAPQGAVWDPPFRAPVRDGWTRPATVYDTLTPTDSGSLHLRSRLSSGWSIVRPSPSLDLSSVSAMPRWNA